MSCIDRCFGAPAPELPNVFSQSELRFVLERPNNSGEGAERKVVTVDASNPGGSPNEDPNTGLRAATGVRGDHTMFVNTGNADRDNGAPIGQGLAHPQFHASAPSSAGPPRRSNAPRTSPGGGIFTHTSSNHGVPDRTNTRDRRPGNHDDNATPGHTDFQFPPTIDKFKNEEIWKTYVEVTDKYDADMIKGWKEGIDVFLVFTGLFSAILSAFLVYAWPLLQPDPGQATVDALTVVSQQLALLSSQLGGGQSSPLIAEPDTFIAPTSLVIVNALWLTGLFFSLFAAVMGMLVKEWLTAYPKDPEVAPLKRVEQRQLRYDGLLGWKVPTIITFLPLAIHLALFLFFSGLVVLAWPVSTALAIWMAVLLVFGFVLYFASALAPMAYDACPYKSPLYSTLVGLSIWIKPLHEWDRWIQMKVWVLWALRLVHDYGKERIGGVRSHSRTVDPERGVAAGEVWQAPTNFNHFVRSYRATRGEVQTSKKEVHKSKSHERSVKLQCKAVVWLTESSDQSVHDVACSFLSWWRMPATWWSEVQPEVQGTAPRKIRNNNDGLVSQHLPLSLLEAHAPTQASEFEHCVNLELIFHMTVGTAFNSYRAITLLDYMADEVMKYAHFGRFVFKYLDLLNRALKEDAHPHDGPSINWECRYPEAPADIGVRLLDSIHSLIPGQRLPAQWEGKQEEVESIRTALIQCLPKHLDSFTDSFVRFRRLSRTEILVQILDGPIGQWRALCAEAETQAIRRLFLELFKTADPIEFLCWHPAHFRRCLEYLGAAGGQLSWLQESCDAWVARSHFETVYGGYARRIVTHETISWLLGEITTSTSPLWSCAVMVVYAALNNDRDADGLRTATLDRLLSQNWLECMSTHGIDYLIYYQANYSAQQVRGDRKNNLQKLRDAFEGVINVLLAERRAEVESSGILEKYRERFGVDLVAAVGNAKYPNALGVSEKGNSVKESVTDDQGDCEEGWGVAPAVGGVEWEADVIVGDEAATVDHEGPVLATGSRTVYGKCRFVTKLTEYEVKRNGVGRCRALLRS